MRSLVEGSTDCGTRAEACQEPFGKSAVARWRGSCISTRPSTPLQRHGRSIWVARTCRQDRARPIVSRHSRPSSCDRAEVLAQPSVGQGEQLRQRPLDGSAAVLQRRDDSTRHQPQRERAASGGSLQRQPAARGKRRRDTALRGAALTVDDRGAEPERQLAGWGCQSATRAAACSASRLRSAASGDGIHWGRIDRA